MTNRVYHKLRPDPCDTTSVSCPFYNVFADPSRWRGKRRRVRNGRSSNYKAGRSSSLQRGVLVGAYLRINYNVFKGYVFRPNLINATFLRHRSEKEERDRTDRRRRRADDLA